MHQRRCPRFDRTAAAHQAFREPKGYLWPPGHPLLAELVPYDPLPETVLELQQAQVAQVAAQVGAWVCTWAG